MIVTNNPGLSQAWVLAVQKDEHEHKGDRSLTEILSPPRIYQLKTRHWDELVMDVSDGIWALLGKGVHHELEQSSDAHAITEQRFNVEVAGHQLSVCPDRVEKIPLDECRKWWDATLKAPTYACNQFYYPAGTQLYRLYDFKVSQVYAYKMLIENGKGDWQRQINGYTWALRQIGFPVVEAFVEILMKDWDHVEANFKKTPGYPKYQVASVPIELAQDEVIVPFLEERMRIHMATEGLSDEQLPYCTEEERWATRDCFAVKRMGDDKAMKGGAKLNDRSEAEAFIMDAIFKAANRKSKKENLSRSDFEIEFRKGESKRCERYCACRAVCNQYQLCVADQPF